MSTKLVEEENTVYEIDEDCVKQKQGQKEETSDGVAKIQSLNSILEEKTVEIDNGFLKDFLEDSCAKEFQEFESDADNDCLAKTDKSLIQQEEVYAKTKKEITCLREKRINIYLLAICFILCCYRS